MELLIGPTDALAEGEVVRHVMPDGRAIALYRINGTFYATDDLCSHGAALLSDGFVEGDTVECPAHGGVFHIPTGRATCFPAIEPVRTYEVAVRAGSTYLIIPE